MEAKSNNMEPTITTDVKVYEGICIWYNETRGYGFANYGDMTSRKTQDVFFHVSELRDNFVPKPGDAMKFSLGTSRNKLCATNINKIQ